MLICSPQFLDASECYQYHTSTKMEIIKTNGGVFFQLTEKDPNGFSFVVQFRKSLKGIDVASYKLIDEDTERFIFEDKNGIYSLQKADQYTEKEARFFKILKANEATKTISGKLFLINNKWNYIVGWYNKIDKIVIPELPIDVVGIKAYSRAVVIKYGEQIRSFSYDFNDNKKYNITTLPNLNPQETVVYSLDPALNEDYLADNDTFFAIRNDGTFEDLTPQMMTIGLGSGMNKMKLLNTKVPIWQVGKLILKQKEGASSTRKNPYTGEDIEVYYAYSNATLLTDQSGNSNYALYQNKIYSIWDEVFSQPLRVNVNPSHLKLVSGTLFKNDQFYYLTGDNFNILNTKIPATAKFFEGVFSYGKYLHNALVDDKYIHFIGDRFDGKTELKTALTAKEVKQLGMFYLFNHSLFDGEHTYPIQADEETLTYLGSFVEVINACSGSDPGSPAVKVNYHNFFKDKDHVYYFNEALKKLSVIQTANVDESKLNNYDYMQALYQIKDLKGTVNKKTVRIRNVNNYLISGIVGIGLIAGLVFAFRKKS